MIYKGYFKFDGINHPGECEIDSNNSIHLTIHESGRAGFKKKITGFANNKILNLYNCYLVDHGIGYYKFQTSYITINDFSLNLGTYEYCKHIQNFRFTFKPLDEWLKIKVLNRINNDIKIEFPEPIQLYSNDVLKIEIKYFQEDEIYGNNINKLTIKPYICVESTPDLDYKKIMKLVQIITRFFAILIGFTDNVNEIKFFENYKGRTLSNRESTLVINSNFSNKYKIRDGYPEAKLRTYFEDVNEEISIMFTRWYKNYDKYKEPINYYFSPYLGNLIEEEFLVLTKCLEKISISMQSQKEINKKNRKLHNLVTKFYKIHKQEILDSAKKSKFKGYVDKIDEIHEEVANSIIYNYNNRIALADRIKSFDNDKELEKHFKPCHVKRMQENLTVYNYIGNTRNYYTHLDKSKPIILDEYLSEYIRVLEKILIKEFFKIILDDNDFLQKCLKKDEYLNCYDYDDIV